MARKRDDEDDLLTVRDVLARLGVAKSTLYYWRQLDVGPPALKLPNGTLRFRRSAFELWLERHEESAA